jgi:hypothetical protein
VKEFAECIACMACCMHTSGSRRNAYVRTTCVQANTYKCSPYALSRSYRHRNASQCVPIPVRASSLLYTPSVSFYKSLDSAKLHYPATNKKKRREYIRRQLRPLDWSHSIMHQYMQLVALPLYWIVSYDLMYTYDGS